jgi:DNA polymerase
MFIFDIPGPEAIQSLAIPNGPEADLFDNIVDKGLKMTADQVYVTAISKCPVPDPANYPETFPLKACAHFLFREIELVGPKVIVALGDKPALRLSGLERTSFQFLRGQRLIIGRAKKIPLKVTYDLPTIMECVDIKREFWNDLKGAMKFLT